MWRPVIGVHPKVVNASQPLGALMDERAAARARMDALQRDHAAMVAASRDSNSDDEHDPEGSTIAFERAQLAAVIEQTRQRLADLEVAIERVRAGSYGTCASCGQPIAAERLAAQPAARLCVDCAAAVSRRPR
ncbi:MAG: DnaK suppressor protein [Pseudonocardiales bacterium]|nr:DnaK suppressor protein [Pseudonocardiales bacterium]